MKPALDHLILAAMVVYGVVAGIFYAFLAIPWVHGVDRSGGALLAGTGLRIDAR